MTDVTVTASGQNGDVGKSFVDTVRGARQALAHLGLSSEKPEDVDAEMMRMQYRVLTADEQARMTAIKGNAASLHGFLGTLGESRELSLAKTKLEEAVMWAVKHITS